MLSYCEERAKKRDPDLKSYIMFGKHLHSANLKFDYSLEIIPKSYYVYVFKKFQNVSLFVLHFFFIIDMR